VPLRSGPTPSTSGPLTKLSITRYRGVACDPERSEGFERVEPPAEAERAFVEIGSQMLGADTVMDAAEPSLQARPDAYHC
jgi:hypothetical protein